MNKNQGITKMDFSLWPACVRHHTFETQLQAAKAGGYSCLPIGVLTYRKLIAEGMTATDIREMAMEYEIKLSHYDGFAGWVPEPYSAHLAEAAKQALSASTSECLEICEALGLTAVCSTGVFDPGKYSIEQLVEHWAEFSRHTNQLGIRAELEFIPMFSIPSLSMAWEIVQGALADNASVFFDTWHFLRGKADMALLRRMPAGSIRTVQIADGYTVMRGDNLFEDYLSHRLPAGQGDLPLIEVLKILHAKGSVDNIGPEIFSDWLDGLPAVEAASICANQTRQMLDQLSWLGGLSGSASGSS